MKITILVFILILTFICCEEEPPSGSLFATGDTAGFWIGVYECQNSNSYLPNVNVTVDGVARGDTGSDGILKVTLLAGSHSILLTKNGYIPLTGTFESSPTNAARDFWICKSLNIE